MSGVGIGLGVRQRGLFTPRLLFARGEAGAWYDPSDIGSMFQDSAGTIAAAVDSPVGRINDKSGRGNHAVQATAAARPMLRIDGGGRPYLEFDGVDDCLRKAFAIAQPWDRISAVRQISWSTNRRLFSGAAATSGDLRQSGVSPQLLMTSGGVGMSVGSLATGVNGILTERHSGATSRIAVNNEAYVTGEGGSTAVDGISIAEIGTTAGLIRASNIRLYGVCMIGRALTDGETLRMRRFLAMKAGVVL
ncbi:MAG TPA: hypothetical protein VNT25_05640 [Allosphingosinicella sp.]|nr:hypothetical protein [Allosphingosinicella sp.]